MKRKNTKKSFMLVGAIFAVFFIGVIVSTSLVRANLHLDAVDLRERALCAFYAAETGIERSMGELRKQVNWDDGFGDISDESSYEVMRGSGENGEIRGYYAVEVVDGDMLNSWPTVWLRSVGKDADKRITRVIVSRIAIKNPTSFFTSTLGNLHIGSSANITGEIFARDVKFNTTHGSPPVNVNNNVYYTRNLTMNPGSVNVASDASIEQIAPITFTSVDLERYKSIAGQDQGQSISGGYSGSIDELTTENGLVFVDGDVHISGDSAKSMNIVSSGNIYIDGDVTCSEGAQIGLFAHNDVIIPENAPDDLSVEAFIVADGGVFKAEGAKNSKGTLNFTGAITARGKQGENAGSAIELNVYNVRNYTYNDELVTAGSIPFLPFIATLVDWCERSISDSFPPAPEE
jgi:hypothetical protein